MARNREDREDLFAEAISFEVRGEFLSNTGPEFLLIGQKPSGWFSIYLSHDEAIHFGETGQVRRIFWRGIIYRSHGDRLARLQRYESSVETTYLRHDLAGPELNDFLAQVHTRICERRALLDQGAFHLHRATPDDATTEQILRGLIDQVTSQPLVLAPSITARRN